MGQRQISDVNVFLSERRGKQKQQPWGAVSAESDCYGSKPEGCVRASIWESESEWERETERGRDREKNRGREGRRNLKTQGEIKEKKWQRIQKDQLDKMLTSMCWNGMR